MEYTHVSAKQRQKQREKRDIALVNFINLQRQLEKHLHVGREYRDKKDWQMFGYMMFQAGQVSHQLKELMKKHDGLKIDPSVFTKKTQPTYHALDYEKRTAIKSANTIQEVGEVIRRYAETMEEIDRGFPDFISRETRESFPELYALGEGTVGEEISRNQGTPARPACPRHLLVSKYSR